MSNVRKLFGVAYQKVKKAKFDEEFLSIPNLPDNTCCSVSTSLQNRTCCLNSCGCSDGFMRPLRGHKSTLIDDSTIVGIFLEVIESLSRYVLQPLVHI